MTLEKKCTPQVCTRTYTVLGCAFSFENTPQVNAIAFAAQKSLILASSASWAELSLVQSISALAARLKARRLYREPIPHR
jgi:hypothetical protein